MLGWKSQAVYQVNVLLVLKFQGRSLLNLEHDTNEHSGQVVHTMIFNSFILCQVIYLLIKLKENDYYLECTDAAGRVPHPSPTRHNARRGVRHS